MVTDLQRSLTIAEVLMMSQEGKAKGAMLFCSLGFMKGMLDFGRPLADQDGDQCSHNVGKNGGCKRNDIERHR